MTDIKPKPAASTPVTLEFRVPVSLGELLDKISILEIKSERIMQEARLRNVRYELALLKEERDRVLTPAHDALTELAAQLKAVNEIIWDAEDVIHGENYATLSEDVFVKQARIAFENNDTRARIKRKINDLIGSAVVEEKSYPDFGGPASS